MDFFILKPAEIRVAEEQVQQRGAAGTVQPGSGGGWLGAAW